MLLRVWEAERPRAVFVAFDTVGTPTYRNELRPQYQSGRDFAKELTLEGGYTLETLPGFVRAVAPGAVTDGPFS
jgi:5'-3' exonuclease